MNNAKNIMKNQGVNAKRESVIIWDKNKVLILGGLIAVVLIVAAVCYEQLRPRLIMTVGSEKIYLTDMMYDIYTQEQSGNSISSIYQQIYGSDYWNAQVDEDGNTGAEVAKDAALAAAQQREVLYQEAVVQGYTLTDEEKTAVAEKVKTTRESMTDAQKKMNGLDEKTLTKVLERDTLASRYKQNVIDSFDIDDAAITKTISKEDNRQYDLQYYYVATKKTDNEGKSTDLSDAEKADLETKMNELKTKAVKAEDFSKLLEENDDSGITYQTKALIETDKDFISDKALKQIKKMKNKEITDVLVGDDGSYYLVRMENNNSTEAYDNAVKEAISTEENTQFEESYSNMLDNYTIEENDDEWDKVKMGQVTL